jgi:hypothetical protein
MMPSDGPVQYTRAAQKAHHASAHKPQNMPHDEESLTLIQDSEPSLPGSLAPIEESQDTPIAEVTDDGMNLFKGDNTPGDDASDDPNTIRRTPEGLILSNPAQEQSYTTAHGSFGLSADSAYFATPSEVRQDKGKGRIHSNPFTIEGNPPHERDRQALPASNEEWEQYTQEIDEYNRFLSREAHYSSERMVEAVAEAHLSEERVEVAAEEAHHSRERIQAVAEEACHSRERVEAAIEAMQNTQCRFARHYASSKGCTMPSDSICAQASRALFAERSPNEGSVDYECQQSAQARFEFPQPSAHMRTGSSPPTNYDGIGEKKPSIVHSPPVCKKTEGSD